MPLNWHVSIKGYKIFKIDKEAFMATYNEKIDLVVSFDTTGSMYPVLAQVRREVEQFVKTMFNEFSDLRLGIIAHGDYCDKDNPYTIRVMDFTRDEDRLCKFVRETEKTFGGDADECYELVLNTAHKCLDWRDDADKVMIMIGDASPHGVHYRDNKDKLDWEEEAGILASYGIKVFAVHALAGYRSSSRAFYKRVAEKTLGVYLTLDMFNEIVDLIKATVYQQGGEDRLNEFITIIRDNGRMTRTMENNLKRLRGEEVEELDYYGRVSKCDRKVRAKMTSSDDKVALKEMGKLVPVMPGRFQVMTVDENCDIKGFVTRNGIEFKKGRGFYELSKAETVQQYKEVIMQDRETGEMFNGSQVREELGLQPQSESGGVKERLHKDAAKKFRVFVQSTSVNRKLIAGTTFLYEISDIEDVGTVISRPEPEVKAKAEPEVKAVETPKEVEEAKPKKVKAKKKRKTAPEKALEGWDGAFDGLTAEESKAPAEEPEADKSLVEAKPEDGKAEEPKADEPTKEEPKPKRKRKTKEEKQAEAVDKTLAQTRKLEDAVERCKKSLSKKNRDYFDNNLKKLCRSVEELAKLFE